jgi:hypothetical protein
VHEAAGGDEEALASGFSSASHGAIIDRSSRSNETLVFVVDLVRVR